MFKPPSVGSSGHRKRGAQLAAVWLFVLGAAAASGWILNSVTFSDADSFAHAGSIMLSSNWQHTYSDSWLQAGPLEMIVCLLGRTLGGSLRGEAVAMNMIGAAALLGVGTVVMRRNWKPLAIVAAGALGVGIISDMWEWGHPSELLIALSWLLAARAARRDQLLVAGLLVGLSAGFETWGLLGAPVLFLLPQVRRTIASGGLALLATAAVYAPFALGGDFHMFDLHWAIVGGVPGYLFGSGQTFSWPMRLAEAVIVVSFGSALAWRLRKFSASVWVVPALTSICRLALDPVRYGYYWDTSLVLLLIGVAPLLASPRAAAWRAQGWLRRPQVMPALVDDTVSA
jgi:hypothetical protein